MTEKTKAWLVVSACVAGTVALRRVVAAQGPALGLSEGQATLAVAAVASLIAKGLGRR